MAWFEFGEDYVSTPGILIVKGNALTVGAYSYIFQSKTDTNKILVLWVHKARHTAKLLEQGAKMTLNITSNFPLIYFCGHTSGRKYRKLDYFQIEQENGYTYIPGSTYITFATILEIQPIHDHYLVAAKVDKVERNYKGERWVKI